MARWFTWQQSSLAVVFCLSLPQGVANLPGSELLSGETVDGRTEEGQLVAIARNGSATFQIDGALRQVPLDTILRWGNFRESLVYPRAVLADGSVVMASAAFQDGALIEFADGIATVQNRYLGATSFDRKELRGMILRPQATRHPLDEQHKRILDYEGIETDTVWLLGGDVIAGDLQRVSEERLVIVADSQVLQIPAQRVSMLALARQRSPEHDPKKRVAVGLRDGTVFFARELELHEAARQLVTTNNREIDLPTTSPALWLQGVQYFAHCVYLSDLEPLAYRNIPYLAVEWPLGLDESARGGPIRVADRLYWKGIAMHSNSRVAFALRGSYHSYHADLAIENSAGNHGSVVFRVLLSSDATQWREAYHSPIIRGGDRPVAVSVDVRGAQYMTLVVEMADRVDQGDHAVWLDPRLLPAHGP